MRHVRQHIRYRDGICNESECRCGVNGRLETQHCLPHAHRPPSNPPSHSCDMSAACPLISSSAPPHSHLAGATSVVWVLSAVAGSRQLSITHSIQLVCSGDLLLSFTACAPYLRPEFQDALTRHCHPLSSEVHARCCTRRRSPGRREPNTGSRHTIRQNGAPPQQRHIHIVSKVSGSRLSGRRPHRRPAVRR